MTQEQIEFRNNRIQIPTSLPYWLTFLLLTFLCYEAHEIFHHLMGAALCGGFGNMTFTVYAPRPDCSMEYMVTLSGPIFSFVLAWVGAYLLSQQKLMLASYTLIFASFAHLRFPLPLMRSGDEWAVVRAYFEEPTPYLLAGVLFLLSLPPLLYAFRSIANQWRFSVFITSWFLPFAVLFLLPVLDEWLLGMEPSSAHPSLLGIPFIVLLVNLAAWIGFIWAGNRILHPSTVSQVIRSGA